MEIIKRKDAKAAGLKRYFTGNPCKHGHISQRLTSSGSCTNCQKIRGSSVETKEYKAKYHTEHKARISTANAKYRAEHKAEAQEYNKNYRSEHRDKLIAANAKYYSGHKDKVNKASKKWYSGHKDEIKEWNSNYYSENKERIKAASKKWKSENPDSVKISNLKHYHTNAEKYKEYRKKYRAENLEKIKLRAAKWARDNPDKVTAKANRRRAAKLQRSYPLTELEEFIMSEIYAESRRLTETTGVKHHVDHVIPLQGEFVSGFHTPSNLQILTRKRNQEKGNTFEPCWVVDGKFVPFDTAA